MFPLIQNYFQANETNLEFNDTQLEDSPSVYDQT